MRFGTHFAVDALAWAVAIVAAHVLRYEFALQYIQWDRVGILVAVTAGLQLLIGWGAHLYRGRFTYGTFEEVRALAATVVVTAVVIALPILLFNRLLEIPRSVPLIALPLALVMTFGVRYLRRLLVEHRQRPREGATPTLVFGAGYLGADLVRRLETDSKSAYRAVGLVDDDRRKRNMQIKGVRVQGGLDELSAIVASTRAEVLIVAIARANAELLRRVQAAADETGLQVKVLPPFAEILSNASSAVDIRDIQIEDLIGRRPVDMHADLVTGYLSGKRVLVTGAGGSIGAELCRQIAAFEPAELMMLDRDETGLQGAQLGIAGHGLLDSRDVVLADIRDEQAIARVFTERQPEVVFHAAALKHLPLLEQYPDEAWKTNVLGTLNVLRAAESIGVETFVNVSTDKAANPTSVLGHSKRVAEKLAAWMGECTGRPYLSVRFGNVIGSRGSLVPTFQHLIRQGKPLTVTHPDATRFFMTIPEACQLVVQAGGIGSAGEVLILDMGEPVRILDIAQRMIAMSGKDLEIVFTGLRNGEKLHEELVGERERPHRPYHSKISHARVDAIPPERLDRQGWMDRMFAQPRNNETAVVPRLTEEVR
ncbi:dTDP-glucose 4,6-dehydratase [Pseudoclavibacter endophyticus]|uniref:Polysaccharide biosynthesis protein n=1 Tax=Pseudoclavibacter endophyticus TaxID=1778590 RepID=A0A6H9WQH5_9MICO|nr:nucleoside-diphosphate sugar epimerase/dehydratase [Pseudoclavibacter endophyticus]KAB1648295.1 polysaccharide biosynthesis protein [Pseudoclavibacter endophyticus]GGA71420.1 dTDP-glucose 4,6-dehydratase [Pseudoclavibacter endophyticus]